MESVGEKIVKIDQYLAKIWTKYNSLLFWPTLYNIRLRPLHKCLCCNKFGSPSWFSEKKN